MKRNYFISKCDNFSIKLGDSVQNAVKSINRGGIQICLVFDEYENFKGIITDSDLRRGILNGISIESKLEGFMNKNPIKVSKDLSEQEVHSIMLKNHIFHIPLIDEKNQFHGIFVSRNLIEEVKNEETFFILAGGKGLRMRPLTENIPKPMLKIKGKPMLELIIANAKDYGFRNFVISLGYLGKVIKDYFGNGDKFGVNINYIDEKIPLGTAGSLAYLNKNLSSEFIFVINGDVVTSLEYTNMLNFAKDKKCDGVIGVKNFELMNPFGVIESKEDLLVRISEKPIYRSTINAGLYVVSRKLISLIDKGSYIDMPQLFELGIKKKLNLRVFALHEEWNDIGRPEDYEKASIIL